MGAYEWNRGVLVAKLTSFEEGGSSVKINLGFSVLTLMALAAKVSLLARCN